MLLTLAQIQPYKSITQNIAIAKLEPYIMEAQDIDLRLFLGDELYIELVNDFEVSPSLATQIYNDLYNGKTYTFGGRTYKHEGIVPILSYFTYARYVANSQVTSTKYGVVQKKNDFSDPLSEKTVSRLVQQARSQGIVYQERVKLFLDQNVFDYPLWRGGRNRRKGSIRINAVGGNSSRKDRLKYCSGCENIVYYNNCECGCTDFYY